MKILVYGAGVLGCNLARNLLRAGKDVTLLAFVDVGIHILLGGLVQHKAVTVLELLPQAVETLLDEAVAVDVFSITVDSLGRALSGLMKEIENARDRENV